MNLDTQLFIFIWINKLKKKKSNLYLKVGHLYKNFSRILCFCT